MTSSVPNWAPKAQEVEFADDELVVRLMDGRSISVPLVWFPRLFDASIPERLNWVILGDGDGIHWPDIDEDISVPGLLRGEASVEAKRV